MADRPFGPSSFEEEVSHWTRYLFDQLIMDGGSGLRDGVRLLLANARQKQITLEAEISRLKAAKRRKR